MASFPDVNQGFIHLFIISFWQIFFLAKIKKTLFLFFFKYLMYFLKIYQNSIPLQF